MKYRLTIFLQKFRLGSRLAAKLTLEIPATIFGQALVECLEIVEFRYRYQEVPPAVAHEILDVPFFVRTPNQAEMMREQIMTLQPEKLARERAATFLDHLGHGDLRVVVADPFRHAAKELERPAMAFLKRLAAFAGINLAEDRVAVRQRHHEHRYLPGLATIDDRGHAEINLSLARRMHKRHEDLGRSLLPSPHFFLHDGLTALIARFAQPLENPLGRVPLLFRRLPVGFENLVDHCHKRSENRFFS